MARLLGQFLLILTSIFPLLSYGTDQLSPELAQKIAALEKELASLKTQATAPFPAHIPAKAATPAPSATNPEKSLQDPLQIPLKEEQLLYKKCRDYLAQGRINLAEKHLNQLVEQYGQTAQGILGQFWLGEIYMARRDYAEASLAYGAAYNALKKLNRASKTAAPLFEEEANRLPEILAKLAFSLKMLGKNKEACITLKQLDKEYKQLPENLAWYAKHLKAELKCR
jgi:TolA-binding protein